MLGPATGKQVVEQNSNWACDKKCKHHGKRFSLAADELTRMDEDDRQRKPDGAEQADVPEPVPSPPRLPSDET
jgi:hypothetical protein